MKALPPRFVFIIPAIAVLAAFSVLSNPTRADAQTVQEAFIAKITNAAQEDQARSEVPASVTMGQAILESGWGRSSLSSKYNNYFGIKCTSTKSPYQSGCVTLSTTEYYGTPATPVVQKASFRTYTSAYSSFADHSRLLTTLSRYKPAFAYKTQPDNFIKAVAKAGYATDPAYATTVISIMRKYNLYQYDLTPADPVVAATAAQKSAFFAKVGPVAQSYQISSGRIPASVLIGQAARHTNYGLSNRLARTNNYFGLTCTSVASPYQTGCYTVTASVGGKIVQTRYRTYSNVWGSFADIARLYTTYTRYASAGAYRNAPESFLKTVAIAGFGGTSYFNAVLPIMRNNRLYLYDMPFTTLRSGQSGFRVAALKRLLRAEGLTWVGWSSSYDATTVSAVKTYQRRVGISASGIADPRTLRSLAWRFTKQPTNQRVAAMQILLTSKGYPTKVWGYYDSTTATRVTQFNARNYGPSGDTVWLTTWGKLFA